MTTTLTHGGVKASTRDTMSELFTTAVSTLGARAGRTRTLYGGTYEDSDLREGRVRDLVSKVALEEPRWSLAFIQWLRDEGNMRTITHQIACEFVHARLKAGIVDETSSVVPGFNRTAINVACNNANEPGEILDYWVRTYGRHVPAPVKRGISDAIRRTFTERSVLYADGQRQDWRLADVIELAHPKPVGNWQSDLFEWLLDRRHGRKVIDPAKLGTLPVILANEKFTAMRKLDPAGTRGWLLADTTRIAKAGLTWEDLAGLGKMDAEAWEAMIPLMGYRALLRNLRNFDAAGISVIATDEVKKRLVDPVAVERAGLFPLAFYAAAREVKSTHWDRTLEEAVNHSLRNVPELPGNTLILVDVSGSMSYGVSGRSSVSYAELAQLFGTALAMRCERANLVQFDNSTRAIKFDRYPTGMALATSRTFTGGGGTNTFGAVKASLMREHTRVVIITDEQATSAGSIQKAVGKDRPLYIFNVAGYAPTLTTIDMPLHKGFGGLTDQAFRLIAIAERGDKEEWPFTY